MAGWNTSEDVPAWARAILLAEEEDEVGANIDIEDSDGDMNPQEDFEDAVPLEDEERHYIRAREHVAYNEGYAEMGAAAYAEPDVAQVWSPYHSDEDDAGQADNDIDIEHMQIAYVNDAGIILDLVPRAVDVRADAGAEPAPDLERAAAAEPAVVVEPAAPVAFVEPAAPVAVFEPAAPPVEVEPAAPTVPLADREGVDLAVVGQHYRRVLINRRGRGIGRGRGRGLGRAANVWRPGFTLQEVYKRDEDIPAAFHEVQAAATARALGRGRGRGRGNGRGRGRGRVGGLGDNVAVQQPGDAAGPGNGGEPSNPELDRNGDIEEFGNDVLAEAAPFLFNDDPEACNFHWEPMDSFHSQPEEFVPTQTGPTQHVDNAYDAFRAIWTDDILDQIAQETNRHASQHTPDENYVPTNRHEILILFVFYMLLGLIKYPSLNSCFSRMVLYRNTTFSDLFSRSRYYWLNRHLHFIDNLTIDKSSRLYKILPLINHLNRVFKDLYIPKQNIAIDESLTLWKGILNFKQYIPSKRARFGIKTFELCCSATGYLWSFFVYTGSDTDTPVAGDASNLGCPKVVSTVLSLVRPLLNLGYRLWMDNWFNSPTLARYLKRNGTDCCGTLRINRLHVPRHVTTVPLQVGQFTARHSQDMSILYRRVKKRVAVISTFHGSEQMRKFFGPDNNPEIVTGESRVNVYKPLSIRDYNTNMGAVDKKDQMLEPYPVERRRCRKWFLKLFKRLLNVTVLNSRVLVEETIGNRVSQKSFREGLILNIVKRHFNETPTVRRQAVTVPAHLVENRRYDTTLGHYAAPLTDADISIRAPLVELATYDMTRPNKRKSKSTDGVPSPKQKCIRKICTYCHDQNKKTMNRTTFKCIVCGVPLCAYPCFQLYHTRS